MLYIEVGIDMNIDKYEDTYAIYEYTSRYRYKHRSIFKDIDIILIITN